jgi:hypothetical protein
MQWRTQKLATDAANEGLLSPEKIPYGAPVPASSEFPTGLSEYPRPYDKDKPTPENHIIKQGTRDAQRRMRPGEDPFAAAAWEPDAAAAWARGECPPRLELLLSNVRARKKEKEMVHAQVAMEHRYVIRI